MARLWSSGFELNSTTAGMEWSSVTGAGSTVQGTTVRSGSYAGRITSLASTTRQGFLFQFASAVSNGPYFVRAYFRFATLPSAENTILSLVAGTALSSTIAAKITIDNGGLLRLYNGGSQVGSASSALSTNTWYCIEMQFDKSPAAGSQILKARLDQSEFAAATNLTISNGAESLCLGANLNAESQTTGDWYIDDVAINDNTGSAQTSYPGSGKIVHLRPNAAGDNNTWQKSDGSAGTSTNYQDMDENPPDDGTTFLERTGTPIKTDDYNIDSSASAGIGASDTINVVQVGLRGGSLSSSAATARDVLLRLKSQASGTVVKSGTSTNRLNTTTWVTHTTVQPQIYQLTSYTDPQAGGAWTPSLLDTAQIGVENQTSSTTNVFISAIWLLVDFATSSNVTTTKTQTGVSRIQVTTQKTQTGVSRIQKTVQQTQSGLSRIQKTTQQTQTGVANIRNTTTRAQTGVARIQVTVQKTQTGISRISITSVQTITGKSRITATSQQSQTGVANVRNTTTKTQTGLARIQITSSQAQSGLSRIQKTVQQTVTGLARITATTQQTQAGKANIRATTTQGQPGKARVQVTATQTQAGISRIQKTVTKTIAGLSRIQATVLQTITGLAKILNNVTTQQTITGLSRIQATTTRTQAGLSRIQKTIAKTITGTASLVSTTLRTITGKANIVITTARTITGKAKITPHIPYQDKYVNQGSSYSDKYSSRSSNYSDKYSARGSSYSDKYSNRGSGYNDKYSTRNTAYEDKY